MAAPSNDMFLSKSVAELNNGKHKKENEPWNKTKRQRQRYTVSDEDIAKPNWQKPCNHKPCKGKKVSTYRCTELEAEDITEFRRKLFRVPKKLIQDAFLSKYIHFRAVKRRRSHAQQRARIFSRHYFIPVAGSYVPVCAKSFESAVFPIKANGIRGIGNIMNAGRVLIEKRGGSRVNTGMVEKKERVKNFIGRLHCRESHYGGAKSKRVYLPAELRSIRKLWSMYTKACMSQHKVTYITFYTVFTRNFNIGFSSPRTDVCTTCERLSHSLKLAQGKDKVMLMTELRVHKLRAKAFYSFLKKRDDKTYIVAYDMQQVQVLPKVPVQEAYYSRQLGLYNFGLCDLTAQRNVSYTWLESESGRGSNEMSSAVYHYLTQKAMHEPAFNAAETVQLFSDGCAGQNKNNIVLGMATKWLRDAPANISKVELIFPVRGHSFLPCDRLFGRIQQDLKKIDTIVLPEGYHKVFGYHCDNVLTVGKDWSVGDWKTMTSSYLKPLPNLQETKRVIIEKKDGKITMKGELFYMSDTAQALNPFKRGKGIADLADPMNVRLSRDVADAKVTDIHKLLSVTFGKEWGVRPELQLYKGLGISGYTEEDDVRCNCLDEDIGLHV